MKYSLPRCARRLVLCVFQMALITPWAIAAESIPDKIEFNRDIRPILSEHCFACHGPDKNHREADLRLDVAPFADGDVPDGQPIVPGKPSVSELVARVTSTDPETVMPPPETHKPLTETQKATLAKWIEQGAMYQGHWAYMPLSRPAVPDNPWPNQEMRLTKGSNPIDAFVNTKLKDLELEPASMADRRTLIRRLSLDLCGLPPDPNRVEAFVNDPSPKAYEELVEEYLNSPAFAEKQTTHWLDAVRYADTAGFHGDQDLTLWPYRDYVLQAFQSNMPFDQFTREQIAGDLLPNPTPQQLTATAFNRLNRMSSEGGVQDKEYRAKYAADRVRTISMVWLGSTLGCAECHDHKYDPFTAKDFYSMAAFFGDIEEFGFYPSGFDRGDWGPTLELPTNSHREQLKQLSEQIDALDKKRQGITGDASEYEQKVKQLQSQNQHRWKSVVPVAASSSEGAVLAIQNDGLVVVGGPNPDYDSHTLVLRPGAGVWTTVKLVNEVDESLPGNRVARGWKSFVVSEFEVKVTNHEQRLVPVVLSSVQVDRDSDRFPGEAAIDGRVETGWAVEHGHSGRHTLAVTFASPVKTSDETELVIRIVQRSDRRHATLGRYRLALSQLPGAMMQDEGLSQALTDALAKNESERNDAEKQLIAEAATQAARTMLPEVAQRNKLLAQKRTLQGAIPRVLYTKRADQPRAVRFLPRGNWMDESGEVMTPRPPEFLSKASPQSLEGQSPSTLTRLDLANWLMSQDNPLTARTLVNRWWQQFLGAGLSKQLEDIGSQGHWPTHPELLDWLASEFIEPTVTEDQVHAWNMKHIIRLIVTSQAYQRTSIPTSQLLAQDPSNQWLARQSTYRVDAEVVRDTALAASGLLVREFGGPSVRPYQPSGYWLALNYPKQEYAPSFGTAQYRRSVYMHWQRTFLHPSLVVFDAATREECQVARATSNTPQQALVLLNDPIFVEAARALANRAIRAEQLSMEERIQWIGRQVLHRPFTPDELKILVELYESQRANFGADPAAAIELLSIGEFENYQDGPSDELAAMTMVSRAVFNLHETITRD